MSEHRIDAHKITKPIQLLAAWLVGLAIIDISFLTAASQITAPAWIPGILAIAAVLNVPVFVFSIFLLQTKFRPEMQEDSYYSDYLNRKSDGRGRQNLDQEKITIDINRKIEDLSQKISELAKEEPENLKDRVKGLISDERVDELAMLYGDSRSLSELYLRKDKWFEIVEKWRDHDSFENDIEKLIEVGLVNTGEGTLFNAKLTDLGLKVAQKAEAKNLLFSQSKSNFFWREVKSNKSMQPTANAPAD